jgi:tryptophan-rich sensory protein
MTPRQIDPGTRFGARGGQTGILVLLVLLALPFTVGFVAARINAEAIPGWYTTLVAPPGNPPNWVFPPVWTALYLLMGVAAWRVWLRAGWAALLPWFAQLAVNALWTPAFFGLQSPKLGLAVILLLVGTVAATLLAFRRHDRVAAALLVPYFVWVVYAAYLNAGFVWLNS